MNTSVVGEQVVDDALTNVAGAATGRIGNFFWLSNTGPASRTNPIVRDLHVVILGATLAFTSWSLLTSIRLPMFFSASERLAEATGDLGDLAERLDAFLGPANESWVLEPDEVASALRAPSDQLRYMLELATKAHIGLLRAESYLQCSVCDNLMPAEHVRTAFENGDEIECTQCSTLMTGKEPETAVYGLSCQTADEARLRRVRPERTVVILTALELEQRAVHAHLDAIKREVHNAGTVYFVGSFNATGAIWRVATVSVGAGNAGAAAEAERAIHHFKPDIALFVGIAGGIKDVSLGDVVAANEVYLYHAGKALDEFMPRPEVFRSEPQGEELLNRY